MMDYIRYSTQTFCDVYPSLADFSADYAAMTNNFYPVSGTPFADPDGEVEGVIYYLLYARYGNNPIANNDVNQWKFKLWATIFAYGPTWEKKQAIQGVLRGLTEDDLLTGANGIFNHSFNPSTAPTTDTMDELTTINEQSVNKTKRAKMDAYSTLWDILRANPTDDFLVKFRPCFKVFVGDQHPIIYMEEDDEE